MKILTIGDVVGERGTNAAIDNLEKLIRKYKADFCIVNAENAFTGNGITRKIAEALICAGADVLTLGNHAFRQREAHALLENSQNIVRPINYPPGTSGRGFTVVEKNGVKILVANALGRVYMDNVDCPFRTLEEVLKNTEAHIKIVDFHAEATSEKRAMGFYLDGLASVVFGTHTHIQTSDAQILPKGCGYITDIGMTGPWHSCIGVEKSIVIDRFVKCAQGKFEFADSAPCISGAVFDVCEESGKCLSAESFTILPGEAI